MCSNQRRLSIGTPFSASGTIDPRRFTCDTAHVTAGLCTAAQATAKTRITKPNPGYITPPQTATYFFGPRGQFRTDNLSATDLALNWNAPPFGKVQLYIESELRNMFNQQAVVTFDQTILTNRNTTNLRAFDPKTDTPIECPQFASGATCLAMNANWQKGPLFGKPTTTTNFDTQGGFQLPRTFLISAGLKF